MTYIPNISPVLSPKLSDTDHRDLITALKLLSGEECVRDARQAQVILLGLTESHHVEIANDARAIMQAGLKQGWFVDTVPNYYTLRNIAERSIEKYEKAGDIQQKRITIALILGVITLLLGVVMYFRVSGTDFSTPFPMILVAVLIFALLSVFLVVKKT